MVISSDLADPNDFHFSSANRPTPPRTPEHTLQDQGSFIPDDLNASSAWRVSHPQVKHPGVFRGGYGLIDFNDYPWQGRTPVDASQVWGLPKLPVVVYRDNALRAQPDPWEAVFSMRLSAAPASTFETQGESATFAGVTDYAVQNAFASGMAYYHRRGHLREPANMLNPFWRATLVPMDINANGQPTPGSSARKNQFLSANHAAQMQAGWRPGDVGMMYMMGSGQSVVPFPGRTVPAWVDVYDKLVNDGQFKGIQ
jgi:hypothetical protein